MLAILLKAGELKLLNAADFLSLKKVLRTKTSKVKLIFTSFSEARRRNWIFRELKMKELS